jgi:hypothetical protein
LKKTQPSKAASGDMLSSDDATATVNRASEQAGDGSTSSTTWISRRDRHAQLINSSVYDKESIQRTKAIEKTRQQQVLRRDQRERLKINKHLQLMANRAMSTSSPAAANQHTHNLLISGLQFQICDGGSKLMRIRGTLRRHLDRGMPLIVTQMHLTRLVPRRRRPPSEG